MIESRKVEDERKPIEEELTRALMIMLLFLPQHLDEILVEARASQANGIVKTPQFFKNQIDKITDAFIAQNREQWRADFTKANNKTIDLAKKEIVQAGYVAQPIQPAPLSTSTNLDVPITTKANYVEAGASSLNKIITDIALGYGFLIDAIIVWNWVDTLVKEEVERLHKQLETRTEFAASNTVLKVYTASLETMCESLGIDGYWWQTQEDSRVRHTHAQNNGKYFTWKKPSKITGKPGDEPKCRCICRLEKVEGILDTHDKDVRVNKILRDRKVFNNDNESYNKN